MPTYLKCWKRPVNCYMHSESDYQLYQWLSSAPGAWDGRDGCDETGVQCGVLPLEDCKGC